MTTQATAMYWRKRGKAPLTLSADIAKLDVEARGVRRCDVNELVRVELEGGRLVRAAHDVHSDADRVVGRPRLALTRWRLWWINAMAQAVKLTWMLPSCFSGPAQPGGRRRVDGKSAANADW